MFFFIFVCLARKNFSKYEKTGTRIHAVTSFDGKTKKNYLIQQKNKRMSACHDLQIPNATKRCVFEAHTLFRGI